MSAYLFPLILLVAATGCATDSSARRGLAAIEAAVPEADSDLVSEDPADLRAPAASREVEASGRPSALTPAWRAVRAVARELGRRNGDPGYREDFVRRELRFSLEDDDRYLEFLDGKRDAHATRAISLRVVRARSGGSAVVEVKVIGEVSRRGGAVGTERAPAARVNKTRFRDRDAEEKLLDRVDALLAEPDFK